MTTNPITSFIPPFIQHLLRSNCVLSIPLHSSDRGTQQAEIWSNAPIWNIESGGNEACGFLLRWFLQKDLFFVFLWYYPSSYSVPKLWSTAFHWLHEALLNFLYIYKDKCLREQGSISVIWKREFWLPNVVIGELQRVKWDFQKLNVETSQMGICQELLSKTHIHYRMKDNFLPETIYWFKNRWKKDSSWYPIISWISSVLPNLNIANISCCPSCHSWRMETWAKRQRQVELIAKSSEVN